MATSTPRTYAKNVVLRYGTASTTGNAVPRRSSEKADSFVILCPDCPEPETIHQVLACDHGHQNDPSDCTGRGKKIGDVLYDLTADEVTAARTPTGDGTDLTIRFHPADQVERETRPTGIAYAFRPTGKKDPFYAVLCELADNMSVALVGTMILRGKLKIFRITKEDHGLTLVELCYPEELHTFEPIIHDFDPAEMAKAVELMKAATTDFIPAEYADGTAERVMAIIGAKQTGAPVTTIQPAAVAAPTVDLLGALEASLAAAKEAAA